MPDLFMDVDAALAEVPVNILPLLDDTDFKSREVSVAFDAAGMDLVWNFVTTAGAYTQTAVTPTSAGAYDWAHQGDGMYSIEIPASGGASINNDTEGFGWFTGIATGVLPWRGPIIGFRAAGLNNKLIDDAYSATRGLAGTALPDAAADAAGGLPISDAGGLDLDAQIGADIDAILVDTGTTLQGELDGIQADTEDIQAKIGTPAGASVSADIAAIEAQTDDIGVAGAGLNAIPWNAAWDAEVQSEVQDALEANHLDHLLAATYDPASKPGAADALLNELVENDGGVARYTANALEQAPTGGSAPSAADIADAVWDEATAGHTTSGTFGEQAKTDIDAILADTGTDIPASIDALPTAAENADAIWDEARSGHSTAGTFGESFNGVVSSSVDDASATTTAFVTALTEATNDHYNGRIIVFITGALAGQATDITDYVGATKAVTVTALTEAPGDTDRFVIV